MFNFFKKNDEVHPITILLSDLTEEQKMSIMNLFLVIAGCDRQGKIVQEEWDFLNNLVIPLGVSGNKCLTYFESKGEQQIFKDLKSLKSAQVDFLIVSAWEMITCDGPPNENESMTTSNIFTKLDVSQEKFTETVNKAYKIAAGIGK